MNSKRAVGRGAVSLVFVLALLGAATILATASSTASSDSSRPLSRVAI
jgi:hypothetical protein